MSSKRDRILAEMKRRIRAKYPGINYIEGTGGVWGEWRGILPVVHIHENVTSHVLHGKGIYRVTLPLAIEYVTRLSDRRKLYEEGREWLQNLQSAIELDERFTEYGTGEDLCVGFSLEATEIAEVVEQTVDAAVLYTMEYTDRFLGYELHRH